MIKVTIMTPHGLYKKTEASIVNVVSEDGQRGIMPKHWPVVVSLIISKLVMQEGDSRETYAIAGGTLYCHDDECMILTPAIENARDIDLERAEIAKERTEKHLKDPNADIKRATLALNKALNRIAIKSAYDQH